jgi:hypothetical protein
VRDSRDGDYRILQAVTENTVRRVELAYVLIGPVADLAQAYVGIRDEPVHDRGVFAGLDCDIAELTQEDRRVPEHGGGHAQHFRDLLAAALELAANHDGRHDRAHRQNREGHQKDTGRDGLHDLQPGRHHASLLG